MMFQNVEEVHKMYPDKNLMFTEGCADSYDSSRIMDWSHGEKYAYSMINDFNCGTVAWTDWNILLDQFGGPNHVGNYCFAPVHANTDTDELIFTPAYYYIGHFSKYIQEGAQRISNACSRSQLQCTTFQNPDGQYCTIVLNKTSNNIKYFLVIDGKTAEVEILPHAIQTLLY
ncbi:MAG: glycoside hydrolase family 30 protein [Saprospiraceae bacterium]